MSNGTIDSDSVVSLVLPCWHIIIYYEAWSLQSDEQWGRRRKKTTDDDYSGVIVLEWLPMNKQVQDVIRWWMAAFDLIFWTHHTYTNYCQYYHNISHTISSSSHPPTHSPIIRSEWCHSQDDEWGMVLSLLASLSFSSWMWACSIRRRYQRLQGRRRRR